jgi:hypothetical protein
MLEQFAIRHIWRYLGACDPVGPAVSGDGERAQIVVELGGEESDFFAGQDLVEQEFCGVVGFYNDDEVFAG